MKNESLPDKAAAGDGSLDPSNVAGHVWLVQCVEESCKFGSGLEVTSIGELA